jgi:hypothetical protein
MTLAPDSDTLAMPPPLGDVGELEPHAAAVTAVRSAVRRSRFRKPGSTDRRSVLIPAVTSRGVPQP